MKWRFATVPAGGLPQQHRRNDLGLKVVSWTEPGCCCEIDCGEFSGIETHLFAGVENFAFAGVVDEDLKMVRAFLDYQAQTFPLALIPLPAAHHRQYRWHSAWSA